MCVVIPVAEIQTPHSVAFYSCLAVYWLNLLYLVAPGAETAPHDNRAAGSVSSLGQFFVLEAVCLSVGCKELRCKRRNITWQNESKPARLAKKAYAFTSDTQRQIDTIPFIWRELSIASDRMWACPATRQSWDLFEPLQSMVWTSVTSEPELFCAKTTKHFGFVHIFYFVERQT